MQLARQKVDRGLKRLDALLGGVSCTPACRARAEIFLYGLPISDKVGEPLQKRPGLGLGPKSDYNRLNYYKWRLGLEVIEMLFPK